MRTLSLAERLAGAPISWGACEVPGWGVMPAPETVLREMAELGLRGTELGPPGFLPRIQSPGDARAPRLALLGGFVPLVLHEAVDQAIAERQALSVALMGGAGARMLVLAPSRTPTGARRKRWTRKDGRTWPSM